MLTDRYFFLVTIKKKFEKSVLKIIGLKNAIKMC